MEKKMLNRNDILSVEDVERIQVEVPEWGGSVYVQSMTAEARGLLEEVMMASMNAGEKEFSQKDMRSYVVMLCVTDEKGNCLFNAKDIEALNRKSAAAMDRIFKAASEMNVLNIEASEELAKNSKPSRLDNSPTD